MRVFVVSEGYPDPNSKGIGIFEWDQAKALNESGVEIAFLVLDCRSIRRWRRWGYSAFEADGIPVFRMDVPLGRLPDKLFLGVSRKAFASLLRKAVSRLGKPDILHAHFMKTGASAAPAANEMGIPFVMTEHSSWLNNPSIPANTIACYRPTYQQAQRVITVSKSLGDSMLRHFGVRTTTIHNMTDTSLFTPLQTGRSWTELRIVTCGGLIQRKRHHMTIRAFAKLLGAYPYARLTVMGGGSEMGALKQLCVTLGCEGRVEFTDAVSRQVIAEQYRNSDFFVLPSALETFGVVYIEAMAAGLPVIATICGGPEEFVDDSNGLLIPVDDQQKLEDAMLHMASHCHAYDKTGISARISERFSAPVISRLIIQVYRKVIGEQGKGAGSHE